MAEASPPLPLRDHFSRFLQAEPGRLHVAAHSHHPWPDVTADAHQRAWEDAARHQDDKWDVVFGEVVPAAQRAVADRLSLPDPTTVTFGPNTHGFVLRLLSCLPERPRLLTTDAEFHSFARQIRRLEEAGRVEVERVSAEPFATFPERFAAAAQPGGHDLVFLSQVFFDSGYIVPEVERIVAAVPDDRTFVVLDAYHGFMAVPTDFASLAGRAFYLAGGYKYAMAGEGTCFLHAPPGYAPRPVDTGWFAGFGALADRPGAVGYATDGSRFAGATFDPTGLYRFVAVQRWWDAIGLTVAAVHHHVGGLQERFLQGLADADVAHPSVDALVPGREEVADRGHFLTFRLPEAGRLREALAAHRVVTDHRGDRLRFGFGCYHGADDIDALVDRLSHAAAQLP